MEREREREWCGVASLLTLWPVPAARRRDYRNRVDSALFTRGR